MKRIVRPLALIIIGTAVAFSSALADTSTVKGYIKKDGTYVAPHQRTTPNSSKLDNWSTKGNTNPYTGKEGTKDPYKPAKKY